MRLWVEALENRLVPAGFQPTDLEQLFLERLNDIRANPAAYGALIGLDLGGAAPSQPLAFNPQIIQAARAHAQDMSNRGYFDRITPEGKDTGKRLTEVGVTWVNWGESSAAGPGYVNVDSALRALILDANNTGSPQRKQLLSTEPPFRSQAQIGIGAVQNSSGPLVNYFTVDTIQSNDGRPFVTGVVYLDANKNAAYDIGEGLSGVEVSVNNGPSTTTFSSGGYSLQVNGGSYTLTIRGGRLSVPMSRVISVGTSNERASFALSGQDLQSGSDAWVSLLYKDVLGRTPSGDEVRGWVNTLQEGAARDTVANGFVRSAEYSQRIVTAWFGQYLKRSPDSTGLATFTAALGSGASQEAVRQAILSSQEYFVTHGNANAAFVRSIYQDLLGRTPQDSEIQGWVSLAGSSRAIVVAGFLGSLEFQSREIQFRYGSLLRRSADAGGLSHFLQVLSSGRDLRAVEREILMSNEYYASAQKVLWLQGLYRDVLGRTGDGAQELGGWLTRLNSGMTRATVAEAFTGSAEATGRIVKQLYLSLLGREADSVGFANFYSLLSNRGRVSEVIAGITGSTEYYQRNLSHPAQWALAIYRDLLGRLASETEVQGLLNLINTGMSREQATLAFIAGASYRARVIDQLYQSVLRRLPTSVEAGPFLTRLQNGEPDASIRASVYSSDEYFELTTRL